VRRRETRGVPAPAAGAVAGGTEVEPGAGQPRDADGRFLNLDGSAQPELRAVLRWGIWDRIAGRRRASPDHAPVPFVRVDPARLARPPGPGEPARLTWLGHASWLVQLDGASLLVDPALGEKLFGGIARNVPAPLAIEELPPVDAALVSHAHYDHLDLPTLRAVGAPVVAGLGLGRLFRGEGLLATELGWWGGERVRGVRVTFVPARHWSRRGPFDTNRTLWGGFVIEGSATTLYHSGDTAYFDGFRSIAERFPRIDAAMLPIGAYDPPWFMERQHMNPEQAVRAFLDLGAGSLLAMHWGTFKLTDEPLDEPPRRLESERGRLGLPADRVRVVAVGETVEIGGR
jgi:L-ascorbate metabolism protein UlaG (beta-lactamase superfamily)